MGQQTSRTINSDQHRLKRHGQRCSKANAPSCPYQPSGARDLCPSTGHYPAGVRLDERDEYPDVFSAIGAAGAPRGQRFDCKRRGHARSRRNAPREKKNFRQPSGLELDSEGQTTSDDAANATMTTLLSNSELNLFDLDEDPSFSSPQMALQTAGSGWRAGQACGAHTGCDQVRGDVHAKSAAAVNDFASARTLLVRTSWKVVGDNLDLFAAMFISR